MPPCPPDGGYPDDANIRWVAQTRGIGAYARTRKIPVGAYLNTPFGWVKTGRIGMRPYQSERCKYTMGGANTGNWGICANT
ncbi:hypothetical protein OZ401_004294 [Candidatus Chlorohelix allophototropha]|uniref:Uncharacterized protein n=1 Tax=Candidatus Chlorohelix allophototropha TaxID=3003348 RepID=A0ABY9B647_9CHLR|nr:hypothetical protein OZ401_004294 [Chloroflexota bacterium L227-S17]